MKQTIKTIVKKSPAYSIYKKIKVYKKYSDKYEIGLGQAFREASLIGYNPVTILNKAKINNVGIGNFFYSLDHTVMVKPRTTLIGNMPIEYSFIINKELGNSDIELAIKNYVKRINDPRICLEKPTDLKSALQAILFWNGLLWQTGHSLVGLGRLDKVLAPYPVPDDADELILDFLKTLHCEYVFKSATLKGDTGQIIILGGKEENGEYFCNEYTYLFIETLKKLHLPDPKILLRCSNCMPFDLLEMAVKCNAAGIGSPLFSNDDIIVDKLIDFGYQPYDAYNYGVSACWEPLSIGNSLEQNNLSHIQYGKCMNETILDGRFCNASSMDDVIDIFFEKLEKHCKSILTTLDTFQWEYDPLLSTIMNLKKDISLGGAKYNNYGVLSVGMSAAVDSLLNIKDFVFERKCYTLSDIQSIISNDYQNGVGPFAENVKGYGTDSAGAIYFTNLIINKTESYIKDYRNKFGGKVKFGLSSPVYLDFGKTCGATLDGRKAGQPFSTHISRDKGEPLTEIMNFESKLQFSGISSNANVLDVMVPASLIKDNISKFAIYMKGGIKEGIFQLQMNVLSYAQLVDAKAHPEKYPNLIVRVWGFSAYFNDLPEEYKDNLIRRAKKMEMVG